MGIPSGCRIAAASGIHFLFRSADCPSGREPGPGMHRGARTHYYILIYSFSVHATRHWDVPWENPEILTNCSPPLMPVNGDDPTPTYADRELVDLRCVVFRPLPVGHAVLRVARAPRSAYPNSPFRRHAPFPDYPGAPIRILKTPRWMNAVIRPCTDTIYRCNNHDKQAYPCFCPLPAANIRSGSQLAGICADDQLH